MARENAESDHVVYDSKIENPTAREAVIVPDELSMYNAQCDFLKIYTKLALSNMQAFLPRLVKMFGEIINIMKVKMLFTVCSGWSSGTKSPPPPPF